MTPVSCRSSTALFPAVPSSPSGCRSSPAALTVLAETRPRFVETSTSVQREAWMAWAARIPQSYWSAAGLPLHLMIAGGCRFIRPAAAAQLISGRR